MSGARVPCPVPKCPTGRARYHRLCKRHNPMVPKAIRKQPFHSTGEYVKAAVAAIVERAR